MIESHEQVVEEVYVEKRLPQDTIAPLELIPQSAPPIRHYSPSTRGFYSSDIHGEKIPGDAVEITDEEWSRLLDQQSAGHTIVAASDGKPIAVGPTVEERANRLRAARNRALAETDGLVSRHRDEDEVGATTLTHEQYRQLQGWRQALRAIPLQAGFPDAELPARPSWLESKP